MNLKFLIREDILAVYNSELNSIFLLPTNVLHNYFFKLSFINKMNNVSFINGNEIKLDSTEHIDFDVFNKELSKVLVHVNSNDNNIDTEQVVFLGIYIKLEINLTVLMDVAAQTYSEGLPCSWQGSTVCGDGVLWNCYGPPPGDMAGDGGTC